MAPPLLIGVVMRQHVHPGGGVLILGVYLLVAKYPPVMTSCYACLCAGCHCLARTNLDSALHEVMIASICGGGVDTAVQGNGLKVNGRYPVVAPTITRLVTERLLLALLQLLSCKQPLCRGVAHVVGVAGE